MDAESIADKKSDTLAEHAGLSIRTVFLVFILYIVVNSQMFIDQVLTRFTGLVEAGHLTTRGVVMNGILICLAMFMINYMVNKGLI